MFGVFLRRCGPSVLPSHNPSPSELTGLGLHVEFTPQGHCCTGAQQQILREVLLNPKALDKKAQSAYCLPESLPESRSEWERRADITATLIFVDGLLLNGLTVDGTIHFITPNIAPQVSRLMSWLLTVGKAD